MEGLPRGVSSFIDNTSSLVCALVGTLPLSYNPQPFHDEDDNADVMMMILID